MKQYFCTKCNELFISTDTVPICTKCSNNDNVLPCVDWDKIILNMVLNDELNIENYKNFIQ